MKIRTLFVEDEDRGVIPYFLALEKKGFECVLAKDGNEALKKLESKEFDLISIDIMFQPGELLGINIIPIRAGLQLLEMIRNGQIKNCNPNIKVIVLTAVIDREIENQIKKLGISAYLKKPIEFSKVIDTFCNLVQNS